MGVLFLKQPLANLEEEIFLKGGSVVTPQNFDLVLLIKIFARKLNFCFLGLSFDFRTPLLFNIVGFYLKWKLSKSIIGLVCSLNKTILYQWIYLHNCFS